MQDLSKLYKRFLKGECSREEIAFLLEQFQQETVDDQLLAFISEQLDKDEPPGPDSPEVEALLVRNRPRLMPASEGEIHPRLGNRQDRGRGIVIREYSFRWYRA